MFLEKRLMQRGRAVVHHNQCHPRSEASASTYSLRSSARLSPGAATAAPAALAVCARRKRRAAVGVPLKVPRYLPRSGASSVSFFLSPSPCLLHYKKRYAQRR